MSPRYSGVYPFLECRESEGGAGAGALLSAEALDSSSEASTPGGARRRSSSALADFIQRTSLAGEPQDASDADGGGRHRNGGGAVLLQVCRGPYLKAYTLDPERPDPNLLTCRQWTLPLNQDPGSKVNTQVSVAICLGSALNPALNHGPCINSRPQFWSEPEPCLGSWQKTMRTVRYSS